MKTFITVKNGCVDNIMQTAGDALPGEDWFEVPFNFMGKSGDKFPEWFDDSKQRIPDYTLIEQGKRIDKRGRWYNKDTKETIQIYSVDEAIDENDWTRKEPLENEAYQKFDRQKNKWIVDTEKKEVTEKENTIVLIQAKIEEAERRIQRSTIAKIIGKATAEDENYFTQINTEIKQLREEKLQLMSA